MTRIFFLNRFFSPDHSATSILVGDLATHLVEYGHDVHVHHQPAALRRAACTPCPPRSFSGESHVRRLTTTRFGRKQFAGPRRRLSVVLCIGRPFARCRRAAKRRPHCCHDRSTADFSLLFAIRTYGACVYAALIWSIGCRTSIPEVAARIGRTVPQSVRLLRFITILRDDRSLAGRGPLTSSSAVIWPTRSLRGASRPIASRSFWGTDWTADDAVYSTSIRGTNPLRRKWQLEDKFVVGYSGNLGRAHHRPTQFWRRQNG